MIKAYTGKTGSGKTYLMVKDAFNFWRAGRNIYSNTILNFENKKTFLEKIFFWRKIKRGKIKYFENITEVLDIKDGVVLFDEAQVLFNARNWESLPDEFQYKLQQHRKHQIDLICTTQNMGTIDITYRRLIHEWVHCKNLFQLGSSPRIFLGIFQKQYKDVDYLYNTVDDLVVPTIKTKLLFIHYWSKVLYDTMYDIGFTKFKTIWITKYDAQLKKKQMFWIIPKKMSLQNALKVESLYRSLWKLNKYRNS